MVDTYLMICTADRTCSPAVDVNRWHLAFPGGISPFPVASRLSLQCCAFAANAAVPPELSIACAAQLVQNHVPMVVLPCARGPCGRCHSKMSRSG
jgi:hypothetical protein